MTSLIRPLAYDDFPEWLSLWEDYNAFYGRSGVTSLPSKVTETTWSRLLDASEPMFGLVAVSQSRVIGIAHYLFHRSTSAIEMSCYLQDLFTEKNSRGHGAGRALIEAVYRAAKAQGTQRVYWHTQESNLLAQKLYDQVAERSGFIVYRKIV